MPFGVLFAAVAFVLFTLIAAPRLLMSPGGVAKLAGVLVVVQGLGTAAGLAARHVWARWAGVAGAILVAFLGIALVLSRGAVLDHILLVVSLAAVVLLALPMTGDVRRGVAPEVLAAQKPWRWLAAIVFVAYALLVVLSAVSFASQRFTGRGRAAAVPPGGEPRASVPRASAPKAAAWADWTPGFERAKKEGKPVLVAFVTSWCGYCKRMDQNVFPDPAVTERLRRVVPVRVDAEEESVRGGVRGIDLAERFEVEVYPTLYLLDPSGKVISRMVGSGGVPQVVRWLDAGLEKAGKLVASAEP